MTACPHCGEVHTGGEAFCPATGKLIAPERRYPPGTVLAGKYRLGQLLGAGGMGLVFEAVHLILDERVAVKLLLPELIGDRQMTARILREGRAAGAIRHPHIVMVTDMDYTDDGALFVVMEHVAGTTLKAIIARDGPLAAHRAVDLVLQALAGLEAAHKKGIIHRDLKPENLMVAAGESGDESEVVKILDFGIAKRLADKAQRLDLTQAGQVVGTPQFMAPEQARGVATLDPRADLYAIGAILYTCLAGDPPLDGDDYTQLLLKLLDGDVPPLAERRADLPPALYAIVAQAMAVRVEDRFADARAFATALRSVFAAEGRKGDGAQRLLSIPVAAPMAPSAGHDLMDDCSADSLVTLDDAMGLAPQTETTTSSAATPSSTPAAAPVHATAFQGPAPLPEQALDLAFAPHRAVRGAESPYQTQISTADVASDDQVPVMQRAAMALRASRTAQMQQDASDRLRLVVGLLVVGVVVVAGGIGLWVHYGAQQQPPPVTETAYVTITVETIPANAEIYIDSVRSAGTSSYLPQSATQLYQFSVRAPGYLPQSFSVRPDRDHALQVTLRRRPQ